MSDRDRNVDRNIYPDSVTRDGIRSDVLGSDECRTRKIFQCVKRMLPLFRQRNV